MLALPSTTSICDSDQSLLIGGTSMLSAYISNSMPIPSNASFSQRFPVTAAVQLYCYCKKPDDLTYA